MTKAETSYRKLVDALADGKKIIAGQMFGKPCLKVSGKAFLAQHKEAVVFKLTAAEHKTALALDGASLWDPSGKSRPMKAWVAVPVEAAPEKTLSRLANAALLYASADA